MIGKKEAELFLSKHVGIVHVDSGKDVYLHGILTNVTDSAVILIGYNARNVLISLDSIKKIRELVE